MKKEFFTTGIIVTMGILIIIFVSFYMNKIRISASRNYVYAVIDNADGVNLHDQVRVRGVRCGYVDRIQLCDDKVVLKIWLDSRVKVTKDTYAGIHDLAIIGGSKYLMLYPGTGGPYRFPEDTIEARRYDVSFASLGMVLEEIKNAVDAALPDAGVMSDAFDSLYSAVRGINRMISENEKPLANTIENLSEASMSIKTFMDSVYPALESVKRQMDSYEKSNSTVKRLLQEDSSYIKLNRDLDKLEKLIDEMRKNRLVKGCL